MTETKDIKIGVYVCHCGGNISDVVDTAKVVEKIRENPKVAVAKHYMFMCSDPGQNLIVEDIKNNGLTHVIVGACSPNLHRITFQRLLAKNGINPYLYEHVNLREQDSWVHSHHPKEATDKAINLLTGAIERVSMQEPLNPIKKKTVQNAVVIGGGISGLTSALDLARTGISVDLVENTPFLGGRTIQLQKLFPTEDDAVELVSNLIAKVMNNDLISVYLNTEIIEAEGAIGNYELVARTTPRGLNRPLENFEDITEVCPVSVKDEFEYGLIQRKAVYKPVVAFPDQAAIDWKTCTKCGNCIDVAPDGSILLDDAPYEFSLFAGAIILATGFNPYEPKNGEFGYGESPFVVTLPQLNRVLAKYPEADHVFKFKGKTISSVAIIHCVGSRQEPKYGEEETGNTYCSRVCCTASLQAATELKDRFSGISVYELYRDIRSYGEKEYYYENASKKNVIFLKYPDDAPPEVKINPTFHDGMIPIHTQDILTYGQEVELEADLVVLAVGMEAREHAPIISLLSIPTGNDKFILEAHPKLRPVESSADGIFISGTAQAPKDTTESTFSASAAAAKASAILLKQELELSPFVATVNEDACSDSGSCIAECEYHAIAMQETGTSAESQSKAVINPGLCVGCGACVPACPHNAISLKGYDLAQIKAEIHGFVLEVQQ